MKDYFKAIYARLDTNGHQQLVARLSADQPTRSADRPTAFPEAAFPPAVGFGARRFQIPLEA
ncbi:hypothetical protein LJR084_007273 [Variovorax sp. LjRoot84]|uniref:hypothetical protein n=1 Tax=Variovorax sp. LjRoot84 TaxID=3342340 RepID=UPI003ECD655D